MFAVIFEVQPKKERFDDYLGLAKMLKPELEKMAGFIDNERFGSQRTEGRILSLSTWHDEKAVIRWRTLGIHHDIQGQGRTEIFADYHLRVGEVTADTHVPAGQSLLQQHFDETGVGQSKAVTISELAAENNQLASADLPARLKLPAIGMAGILDQEVFASITNPGKLLLLTSWEDATTAHAWHPAKTAGPTLRHRQVRIIRDYGMNDRREAPQFYPPVAGSGCPYDKKH